MAIDVNRIIRAAAEAVLDGEDAGRNQQSSKKAKRKGLSGSRALLLGAGVFTAGRLLIRGRGGGLVENLQQRLSDYESRLLDTDEDEEYDEDEDLDESEDFEPDEGDEPEGDYDEEEPEGEVDEEEPEGEVDEEEPEGEVDEEEPEGEVDEEEPEGEADEDEPEGEADEDVDGDEPEDDEPEDEFDDEEEPQRRSTSSAAGRRNGRH